MLHSLLHIKKVNYVCLISVKHFSIIWAEVSIQCSLNEMIKFDLHYSVLHMCIQSDWSFVCSIFGGPCWWKTSNFIKLVLVSHTTFSLWVYITCLHEGTVPPQLISLETLHFQKMLVLFIFFFCIRRLCRLTTSESNGATEKWLLPWQAQRPRSNISTLFHVNQREGQVDIVCCCFITTVMTNLYHITPKHRG